MFKVLASRIIIFAVAIMWVCGWLTMGLAGLGFITTILLSYQPAWLILAMQIWYIGTVIVIGIWVAVKGFRFVGRWETK